MIVVLPAPFGPMQAVTLPGGTFDRDVFEDEDAAEIHRQPVDVKAAIL